MILDIGLRVDQTSAQIWAASHSVSFPVLYDRDAVVTPLFVPDWGGGTFLVPHSCIMDDEQTLWWTHYNYTAGETYQEMISVIETLVQPELGANVEEIDFGDVNVGESSNFEVYLDNVRTGIVDVTSAIVSGAPYSVDFTAGEIYAVDDEMLVTVTFAPTEGGTSSDNLVIESSGGNLTIPLTGNGMLSVGDEPDQNSPSEFALEGNFPNPFNSSTEFLFTLPADENVKVEIFNISGKLVDEMDVGLYSAGTYTLTYNASDLISGIYFARLTAGYNSAVTKMVLIK